MKITEMKGASLLPVKKEIRESSAVYMPFQDEGFNSAVTQLEQCSVEVDCEEIQDALHKIMCKFPISPDGDVLGERGKDYHRLLFNIASSLSKCKQNWLRLEVRK